MQRVRRTNVNSAAPEKLSLEIILHLMWRWLKFSGLHPNLLLISVEKYSTSDILRWLFTLIILLLVLVLFVFQSLQLIIESWNVQNMVDIVPNVLLTLPLLFNLFSQFHLWSRRHQIKQFFEDWKVIERQMNCFESSNLKRDINSKFIIFYLIKFVIVLLLILWNWMDPERSFFMTYYVSIRETFGVLPISVAASIISGFNIILYIINLTIPMISFYVIARYVENLGEEWESSSKNERLFRVIWQRYESILHLVDRANELYGTVINELFLYSVLVCIMTLFYALKEFQQSFRIFLSVFTLFIYGIQNTVSLNQFLSRLYFSKDKLQKSIADHLSLKWYQLNEDDRQLLVTFLSRLGKDDICVRPMKLYSINPSNLLDISALIINYFIVLSQAN